MEQRDNRRFALTIDVMIYQDGVPIAVGMTRDLSRGGVYILADKVNLFQHTPLEIELNAYLPTYSRHLRVNGEVVHNNHLGFGMVFRNADEEIVTAIQESGVSSYIPRSMQRHIS